MSAATENQILYTGRIAYQPEGAHFYWPGSNARVRFTGTTLSCEVTVNVIRGADDSMRYDAVPSVFYTNPEVASVGETEESARERGLNVKVLKLPMLFSGRYQAENEGGNGILKLVLDEEKHILGVTAVGNPASEFIAAAALAVTGRMTAEEFTETIFPHPTVSEILRDAALMEL